MKTRPRIISLGAGGGAGECGSNPHFDTVLAVDYEQKYLDCFEANHPGIRTLCRDISDPETITEAKRIAPRIEGIIASTDCTDYCQAKSMSDEDRLSSKTSYLYVQAIDWVIAYRPQFYLAENSPNVRKAWYFQTATERLEAHGYRWEEWTLDAADFGTPQHRTRTFLVAVRKGVAMPKRPKLTHGSDAQRKNNPRLKKYLTLKDCIYDLFLRELKAIEQGEQAHERFLNEEMLGVAKLTAERAFYLSFVPPGGHWKHLPQAVLEFMVENMEEGRKPFGKISARFAWLLVPGALKTFPSVKKVSMPLHPGVDMATLKMILNDYARPNWGSPSRALAGHPSTRKLLIPPGINRDDLKAMQKAGFWARRPAWTQPSASVGATPNGDKRAHVNPGYRVDDLPRLLKGARMLTPYMPVITRYLTVREYCRIMGLPDEFKPTGSLQTKYAVVGNGIAMPVMERVCGAVAKVLPKRPSPKRAKDGALPIINGDALEKLKGMPSKSANTCVTSPPYYQLRDYGVAGQIGLEKTVEEYVQKIVEVFREVKRVLRDDGTCWLNIADTYVGSNGTGGRPGDKQFVNGKKPMSIRSRKACSSQCTGLPPKNMLLIPQRVAIALQRDGWIVRSDIIWHKPNVCPESVKDRPTRDHEHVLLLSKKPNYFYDQDAIRELRGNEMTMAQYQASKGRCWLDKGKGRLKYGKGRHRIPGHESHPLGRNKRTVWKIPAAFNRGIHRATFPPALVEICIKAGCPPFGVVLDPFAGSGTTGVVAKKLGRNFIGIELNRAYCKLARARLSS